MALLTDRKFIHFNRKSDFEALLNANTISDKLIVFLKDAQEIWTHGTYYNSVEQFLDETNKDSTNAISAAAVYKALTDDEKTIAAALNDLNDRIENLDIPSKVSDLTDDLSLATLEYVDDKLDDVLGVSAAGVEAFVNMTRDEDTATGILTEIANKAPKTNAVNGAPLSNTESYFYGTSTTAAATALKEVSIPSITSLKTGQIIVVKPTITSTVANSTIKLNNFTAYPMRYNNAAITTSTDSIVWAANIPSIWVFDGTYWVFLGHGLDSNTTYSAMTQAEATTGTATSARTISAKVLTDTINDKTFEVVKNATTNYPTLASIITGTVHTLNTNNLDHKVYMYSSVEGLAVTTSLTDFLTGYSVLEESDENVHAFIATLDLSWIITDKQIYVVDWEWNFVGNEDNFLPIIHPYISSAITDVTSDIQNANNPQEYLYNLPQGYYKSDDGNIFYGDIFYKSLDGNLILIPSGSILTYDSTNNEYYRGGSNLYTGRILEVGFDLSNNPYIYDPTSPEYDVEMWYGGINLLDKIDYEDRIYYPIEKYVGGGYRFVNIDNGILRQIDAIYYYGSSQNHCEIHDPIDLKQRTLIHLTATSPTATFTDINNNTLTHAEVIALLENESTDLIIKSGDYYYILQYYSSDGNTWYYLCFEGDSYQFHTLQIEKINSTLSVFSEDYPYSSGSHSHGNITNTGDITATAPTIANGDQLVINDHSASKITNGPTFDGTTTTLALSKKGTWETFLQNHQSIKSLNTNNTSAQTVNASETITGSGTINLHKVSKTGSYSDLIKPSTGIPKTDLASAVQTSLGKADTAIQGVKVNGTALTPDTNRVVDVTIPTNVSDLTNDLNFVRRSYLLDLNVLILGEDDHWYENTQLNTPTIVFKTTQVCDNILTGESYPTFAYCRLPHLSGTDLYPNTAAGLTSYITGTIGNTAGYYTSDNIPLWKTEWWDIPVVSLVFDNGSGGTNKVPGISMTFVGVLDRGAIGQGTHYIAICYNSIYENYNFELKIFYDLELQRLHSTQPFILNISDLGEVNTIETIKVNNIALTPDANKAVNISITNEGLGNGYAIQTDNGQTQNITASLTGYVLTINGRVSVKFNHDATYTPTLNINGTGAKTIKLADGSSLYQDYDYIKGGDIATFVYDGTYYRLVNVQRPKEFDSFLVPDPIELTLTDDSSSGIKVCSFSRNGATVHLPFWSTDTVLYNGVVYSDPQWSDAGPNLETYVFSNTSTEGIIQYLTIYHQFDPTYMGMVDEKWFVVTDEIVKTISIGASVLSEFYEPSSLDNEDLLLAAGDTYEEAFGKLEKSINDNEQITAAALTDLDSRINTLHLPQSLDDIPDGSTRKLSDYATTTLLATKQDALVSGTNIKTINNESILGSGNITIQGGSGGDTNVIETVKVNGTALIPDANKAVDITSIPASIVTQDATHRFVSDTEKTTWNGKQNALQHYTENNGVDISTLISEGDIDIASYDDNGGYPVAEAIFGSNGIELNAKQTSTGSGDEVGHTVTLSFEGFKYDNKLVATVDQIPSAVTESTVSGWGFTKNAGTITGITMNGASKGTSGVVNLGTVLTEHQTLKTINNESIVGTGNLTVSGLPTVTASDNGKILQVVNGAWALVTPTAIYSGTSTPDNTQGNNGDLYLQTS